MSGTPTRPSHETARPAGGVSDANALVLAEPSRSGSTCPCSREAHDGTAASAGTDRFLRVAFTRAGRDPPREWADAAGADVHVVDATPCPSADDLPDGVVGVEADGPGNLTDLGVRITDALGELAPSTEVPDGTDAGPVCCLGSLTALLQYVDTREAYRFLNAVTSRVSSHGGVAHAHLRPEAHDDRTVDTLTSLFDVVAETAADGEALTVVRSRR